jgi:hypothetical protein
MERSTEERVWAAFAESDRQLAESKRLFNEQIAESKRLLTEQIAESDRQRKESERLLNEKFADTDRQIADTDRLLKETIAEDRMRRADEKKRYDDIRKEIGGISKSNGEFAEEYFENIFYNSKTFAGMQFHEMLRRKRFDDRKRKDEFDLIMLNEQNAFIVETKYNSKEDDIDDIIRKAESFRYWFPEYKDHNVYLGFASLRFEDNIIGKARKRGIAVIQQLGDKTVVNEENLKAY